METKSVLQECEAFAIAKRFCQERLGKNFRGIAADAWEGVCFYA